MQHNTLLTIVLAFFTANSQAQKQSDSLTLADSLTLDSNTTAADSSQVDSIPDGLVVELPSRLRANKSFTLEYYLNDTSDLTIQILDIAYNEVKRHIQENAIGLISAELDIPDLPWGVYYVRFLSETTDEKVKVIISG